VALPRSAQRHAFRPRRSVPLGTKIFAGLVFLLAVGTVGAFVAVVLPGRVATLAQAEATELETSKKGAAAAADSLKQVWTDVAPVGMLALSSVQVGQEFALATTADKATADARSHLIAAESHSTEAAGVPFQIKAPGFIKTDQPAMKHLDKALLIASKLSNGARLQLDLAKHAQNDAAVIDQLNASLQARAWGQVTKTAADLQQALNSDQRAGSNPEALLDPLWAKWMDAMAAYANTAQQYALASASGQTASAQQLGRALAAAGDRLAAARDAAQKNAPTWHQTTVKPLLDSLASELAAL
jgi:hypothetical protein